MNQAITKLFDLTGKSALVSGATGSLGSAAARALAAAGAHVTIAGGNAARLQELAAELAAEGAGVTVFEGRPDSESACDAMVATGRCRWPRPGHPRAGLGHRRGQARHRDGRGDLGQGDGRQRAPDLASVPGGGQADDRAGTRRRHRAVSSVRAHFATPAGTSAYGPSKAAVDMITRSLATEWGPHGIRVNAIAPTVFRSELTSWLFEDNDRANEARKGVLSRIPLGRLAEPEDFAGVLVFLSSPASSIITGETINVDGGFSAN